MSKASDDLGITVRGRKLYYSRGDLFNSERRNHDELVKRNAPHARGNNPAERAYVDGLVASSLAAPVMTMRGPMLATFSCCTSRTQRLV